MRRRSIARPIGVAFILIWTLLPLYWVLNTSLQTDAQISAKPANYLPPTPSLTNYITLLGGSGDLSDSIRQSTVNIFIECAAATIVTVVLATLAAYAFARMKFRGPQRAVLRGAGDDGVPRVHDAHPAVPDDVAAWDWSTPTPASCWSTSPASCRWRPGSCTTT